MFGIPVHVLTPEEEEEMYQNNLKVQSCLVKLFKLMAIVFVIAIILIWLRWI